jgi:hypothetical protein
MSSGHFLRVWKQDRVVIRGRTESYFDHELGIEVTRKAKPKKRKRKRYSRRDIEDFLKSGIFPGEGEEDG